jgi:putative ABC transport system permease protein
MFLNLVKYSIRALRKQKAYVVINVLGLAIGLAASMMIALFIINEFSYDNYHEHKDRIHKVILHGRISGQEVKVTSTAPPIGPTMVNEFPEVEKFLRMNPWGETIIKRDDISFAERYYLEADSSFFEFFSIPLLQGNPQTALTQPYTLVLTQTSARRIFGDDDPMDQMLQVGSSRQMHRVTGVMADIPENTHFRANMIASYATNPRSTDNQWLSNSFHTYVKLHPHATPEQVNARFPDLMVKYVGPEIRQYLGISLEEFLSQGNRYNLFLQPLSDIKVNPGIEGTMVPSTDPRYFWIFGAIGLLILVIAAINFMNLSTAQATKRAREVGIKKVSGSSRQMLLSQFLMETLLLSLLALLVAMLIVEVTLPWFNQILDLNLALGNLRSLSFLPVIAGVVILIGLLAGSYPAFYLSSFNPTEVLKGKASNSRSSITLRSVLTVLQFSISIMLIVGTLVMFRQINFMLNKDLGFDKEQVMVIRRADVLGGRYDAFKTELLQIPGVIAASGSTAVPGHSNNNNGYMMRGRPEESFLMQTNWVDYDYLTTYGIELADGRFFDPDRPTDRLACLVNERALRNFSIAEPFQTHFLAGDPSLTETTSFQVIGVLKDFHYESLRQEIHPCILRFQNEDMQWGYFSVRLAPHFTSATIDRIESVWRSFASNDPMLFFFMDEDFARQYAGEQRSAKMSVIFTILAIIIASMGLYGLTAFTVAQRTREIGVRRTFGASVADIWLMVSREVFVLVGIATLLAWPLVYWAGSGWLNNFHYRSSLHPADFLAGFGIAVLIAVITISYRTIKTARINPALSLRYE